MQDSGNNAQSMRDTKMKNSSKTENSQNEPNLINDNNRLLGGTSHGIRYLSDIYHFSKKTGIVFFQIEKH